MDKYYVNNNPQTTGEHEVHTGSSRYLPGDRKYLGEFGSCHGAVKEAKKTYPKSDGCYYCCNECHNR